MQACERSFVLRRECNCGMIVIGAADVDFARQRADIATRHRERQLAERIADGDAPFADGDGVRIADRHVRESLRLNLQQRHIAQRIAADDLRRIRAPVVQLDRYIVRALYDVVVRHDVAVFRQHESAAHNRGRRRLPKHVCRHLGCNAAHRVYVDAVDLLRGQRLAAVVGRKRLRERCQLPLIGFAG